MLVKIFSFFKTSLAKKMLLGVLFCVLAGTLILTLLIFVIPIPSVGALREREVTQSTKIYDNKGETLLYEIYNEEKRTVVPFEEIPARFLAHF